MKYMIKRKSGGVSIADVPSMDYLISKLPKERVDDIESWKEIDDVDLPADREFRDAWDDLTDDTKVNIDLSKARDLKVAELRYLRKPLLEGLDKDFMLALEKGLDTAEIVSRKQVLRDITGKLKRMRLNGLVDDPKKIDIIKTNADIDWESL